ncbi:SRR1-like protein isoform X2 [Salmo salar]|uniref:SRR1-like protein isoform X2 n=1 Tax=Salmo salar TaxID=8030 RepID=A0A1S3PF36_SALSA|nr:SRR1-like protein isoform X2 [Salmo salar]|eukprot:XP_014026215.1 PREDICTED: SRR1-like protein isoform X2 [Salmo salar]
MPNSGEEWQVARRRKGAGRKGKIPHTARHEPGHADAVDTDRTKQRITETMAELRCADFWLEWRDRLTAVAKADSPEVGGDPAAGADPGPEGGDRAREAPSGTQECVCYGLGSFSSCVTARYQLAMLLLILESLQIPMERCSVYDPVFSSGEMEEGKRAVSRPTLFYLMHCGKALYNNLLWKNWSRDALPLLTIIGNSFAGIQDRMIQRELQRDYSYIAHAVCVCEEWPLRCPSRLLDIFNDTALITFKPCGLCKLPQSTWGEAPEPQYQHCSDLEIIQRGLQR